ncbi:SMI1/KNR4 family protein [Catelliglobosispora koreensis]|uniref:SMI1/KNR4 family protein n=1 Tax=Catelliglobosispora koreensis TaxID=129052 RepID=UPI0003826C3D|nr:SMI1/KNR4 family protein [Catelliglobosispora koreensis]
MHETIRRISVFIKGQDPTSVVGLSREQIDEVTAAYGVGELPEVYAEFLSEMGVRAGHLLQGTDAFYPGILSLAEDAADFFAEDLDGIPLPDGAIVFAMHQGYQVYWMENSGSPDPAVALYMEGDSAPMMRWETFTEFLTKQLGEDYGSGNLPEMD